MAQACPFCQSWKLHVEKHRGTTVICCANCLAVGPVTAAQSSVDAWGRWNTRPKAPAPVPIEGRYFSGEPPKGVPDFELDDFV